MSDFALLLKDRDEWKGKAGNYEVAFKLQQEETIKLVNELKFAEARIKELEATK